MSRLRSALVVLGAAAAVAAPSASAATPVKLVGTVGPAFTIALTKGGKPVTTLKAGKYILIVNDRSRAHNFVLEGVRVKGGKRVTSVVTEVPFIGKKTITVTLAPGKHMIFCLPHLGFIKSEFTVS